MRIPQVPPDFRKVPFPKDFPRLIGTIGPTVEGKYIHWDKLRRLKSPAGITHEQWWILIQFARAATRKSVPLLSKKGEMFSFVTPDPIPELLNKIDMGAGGVIPMQEQITNPETRNRYVVRSLIEEAITSSQLEGASTTRLVATKMLRESRPPRDTSERMILNNYRTMQHIIELKNESLTPKTVLAIHRMVTEGTLENANAAGRLRSATEAIRVEDQYGNVLHDPPAAKDLPDRIQHMCDFANGVRQDGFIHPVLKAIILHFWLAYDHPFVDGNGRTARALFYWAMLRGNYWLAEFISISEIILKAPVKYGRAFLHTETDNNDLTYFLLHQLDVLKHSLDALHEYVDSRVQAVRELEQEWRNLEALNSRQRALLSHALRHPREDYTIQGHQNSHGVVYQTARTDLLELEKIGFLNSAKIRKKLVFRLAEDIDKLRVKRRKLS